MADRFNALKIPGALAIVAVLMMTVLDVSVVNVALPAMAQEFGVDDATVVWIVSAYQLVITMLLLPVSSAGDLFSYRRIFRIGIAVFTIASCLCAASGTFAMLIASRVLQGIGAACIMGVNIALMRAIYPRCYLGRGMALNAMAIAVSTAAGPTIAGTVISFASWHWIFLINIPFGLYAWFFGMKTLPENPVKVRGRFDIVSAVMNAAVFGLLIFGLEQIGRGERIWIGLPAVLLSAVVCRFYLLRQRVRSNPMLPVDLLRIKLYTLSLVTSMCSFIAQTITMVSLPFLFTGAFGLSAVETGALITPWPIATLIMSPIAARIAERVNPAVEAAVGMACFATGILLTAFIPSDPSAFDIIWRISLCGIGFGLFQTPNNLVLVQATPLSRTGGAGGLQSTGRLLGQTLGAAIVTVVFLLIGTDSANRISLLCAAFFALAAVAIGLTRAGRTKVRAKE